MNNRSVLFVHDGPLAKGKDGNFYGISYTNDLKNNYLFLGEKVSFLMRLSHIPKEISNKYNLIDSEKFSFIEIPNFKSIKKILKYKTIARRIIRKTIEEHDIIIVRLPSAAGTIAYKTALRLNKPVLVEYVACVFDVLRNYDWRGLIMANYKLYQYRKLMKSSKHTIYVTSEFLQNRYPSGGKSIGCSDVEILSISRETLEKRQKKIEKKTEPITLCTISSIDVPYKGQTDVIKAIGQLKRKGYFFKYILIGDGNPEIIRSSILENDVVDLIEIVGPLPHKDIFQCLDKIDVYIQPSHTEGMPRAVIEAMSKACPCLGSDVGGIPELLSNDCVFQPGNINQIAQKLLQINKSWMLEQAKINFEASKEFQKHKLETRRKEFYNIFLNDNHLST